MMNWKSCVRKRAWPNFSYCYGISWGRGAQVFQKSRSQRWHECLCTGRTHRRYCI